MARRSAQLSAFAYRLLLVLSVLSRTYSLRLLVALLRLSAPLVVPAFWLLAGAAAGFALVQRAWSTQPRIAAVQLLRVGANSCVLLLSSALWLSGARHGGALVTILAEQSELLVAAGVSAIATDARAAQQHMLGASLMCVGYLLLVVNDDDDQATDGDGARVRNARYALVAHFAASALGMVRERTSRRLAIGIGGPKRLNALEYAGAFALSTPSALWSAARAGASDGAGEPWSWLAGCETALAALAMLVAPFYARALARTWLPSRQPELLTCATAACAALALDLALGPRELLESACAAVGAALVFAGGGAHLRAQAASAETQSLLGVTSTGSRSIGPPLLARAARAARAGWAETRLLLRLIWLRRTTRRLLLFLLVSGVFTVVEAALGRASSSLSLVSDACHMLLDCSGLAIGLYGELSSHWPPTSTHTYGFGRVEVLCTFANATLLLLTAAALSREALSRIVWGGAPVDTARMLVVALGGLGVNVLGLCLFSEHHVHSGSRACPAGCAADGAAGSSNMAAVLLHIAADALGSLGVIVSSLLIQYAGLEIADPICSLLTSGFIALSAWPLLVQSAETLLQRTPYLLAGGRKDACLAKLASVHGVEAIISHSFWMLTTTQHVGELTAQISPTATARHVLPQLRQIVKSYGIEIITVELLRAGGASTALEPGLLGGAVAELVFDKRSQSAVGELSPMMAASGSIAASSGNAGCGR